MPAAAVPLEETQLLWGQQRQPHNIVPLLLLEHQNILLHLLVLLHQPPEQKLPAEHSQSLLPEPPVRALSTLCEQQMLRSAGRILQDPSHILLPAFEWLPSGCQLCCPGYRTQRATFVPKAVQLLNSQTSLSFCSPCY